jgi:hypothetical protein
MSQPFKTLEDLDNINAELCSNNKYNQKFVRKNNRSLFKANQLKGGRWVSQRVLYVMFGFRSFDKVKFGKQECFVSARRKSGQFKIRKLNGLHISESITYRKLKLIEHGKLLLTERK